jgi:hypothetical protein
MDIVIRNGQGMGYLRKGILVDTAIVSPTTSTGAAAAARADGAACEAAARSKHGTYDDLFDHNDWQLVPLVYETGGRLCKEGEIFLGKLATAVVRRRALDATADGDETANVALRATELRYLRATLSVAVQSASAEKVLAHIRLHGGAVHATERDANFDQDLASLLDCI